MGWRDRPSECKGVGGEDGDRYAVEGGGVRKRV